ncbi:hypothetical protein HY500_00360 [Candidatus Woesearchaeota archaeon]|nr:hypothetical protein [Candidatus Woesearchaeota archaeon]
MKKEVYLGTLRIFLGWIFLWAFFDKLLGLGFATARDKAWIFGNSPTFGFLSNTSGFFSSFFKILAESILVDWLFMLGLLLIGLALIFGVGIKLVTYFGSLLLFLMWLAELPLQNNPLIDEHVIYILVLIVLYKLKVGDVYGYGKQWAKLKLVKKYPILN